MRNLYYVLITSALLSLAWYPLFTWCIFIAFAPYFLYLKNIKQTKWWVFSMHSFLLLLLWNVGVLWWLYYIGWVGSVMAWFANALLQAFMLLLFYFTYKGVQFKIPLIFLFSCFWISYEFLDLYWEFSWIWLQLGNAFTTVPQWVQWYEYTGVFGGTLWVLITNYLFYKSVRNRKYIFTGLASVGIPIMISYAIYYTLPEDQKSNKAIALIQPNIDTYSQKYSYNALTGKPNEDTHIPYTEQVNILKSLTEDIVAKESQEIILVLWPETALHKSIEIASPLDNPTLRSVKNWATQKNIALLTGANSYKTYSEKVTPTARFNEYAGYYDVFNSSIFIHLDTLRFYHKSQLVIGAETVPFPSILGIFSQNLGGTIGTLGRQKEREVFYIQDKKTVVAPVICYESVYGEYVTEYIKKGANLICIITNDGWWGETPGYRQHFRFSPLRAIETRRPVARCANTGVSAFINSKGEVVESLNYGVQGTLTQSIPTNTKLTFYTKYGDYIPRIVLFLLLITVLPSLIRARID